MRRLIQACVLLLTVWLALPASAQDALDFQTAVMAGTTDSPDIRTWPVQTNITRVDLSANRKAYERGPVNVWFAGKYDLPPTQSTQGDIRWTLWGGFRIGGRWHFAPLVECIRDYVPVGEEWFDPGHIGRNLTYYADGPLRGYQPSTGEQIALVVTTGDTRRQNAQGGPPWRTNVVLVPFSAGATDFPQGTPQGPPPQPPTGPTQPQAPQVPTAALDALRSRLEALETAQGDLRQWLEQEVRKVSDAVTGLHGRISVLESRPVATGCIASIAGVGVRFKCELSYPKP